MLALALFVVLMDHTIEVPASHWTAIQVKVPKPHTIVDCSVEIESSGSSLDAVFLTRDEAERFNRNRSYHPLYSTGFHSDPRFRYEVEAPGEYILLLDNRLEGRGPTKAHVRIELWNTPSITPVYASPERRAVTIALSLLFFVGVVLFSARRLWT